MTKIIDYLKYSAKAVWALALPLLIPLVNDAADWLSTNAEMWITAVATAVVVWLQKNAGKPV